MGESMAVAAQTADGHETSASPLNEDQRELSKILRGLRHDPTLMGITSLGTDGILRTLTADRDVVEAIALGPRLIKAFLDRMPYDEKIEDAYCVVDGTTIPQEQWYHPDKSLLPPALSEEQKAETRKMIEENREIIDKNIAKAADRELGCCGVIVRSNYNLESKNQNEKN